MSKIEHIPPPVSAPFAKQRGEASIDGDGRRAS
jgi:hypothetical protein